uniref:hypothetical protein n=1 Tax=Candidatus Fervidibacter sp. TaxID=3100871 RepID=UPI00404B8397
MTTGLLAKVLSTILPLLFLGLDKWVTHLAAGHGMQCSTIDGMLTLATVQVVSVLITWLA